MQPIRCPQCGKIALVEVIDVPLLTMTGRMYASYECPTGCKGEDLVTELNAALGTNNARPFS
jgi:lysyl-tRNA synthetase class I